MTRRRPRNIAASVRQRLLNLARDEGEDFNHVLIRYANERLLYRLGKSGFRDQFVLKGAVLFEVWSASPHRATRDVDLLGFGEPAEEAVQSVIRTLCAMEVPPDGIRFQVGSVRTEPIRDRQAAIGIRVRLTADLDGARISLQADIGFDDVVTPGVVQADFPTLLDFPAPRLQTYPRETVVAEKFEALVRLGIANTRMKDFYDLWFMATTFAFRGNTLARALAATFDCRGTPLPLEVPVGLSPEFSADAGKQAQWLAFGRRSGLQTLPTLDTVAAMLRRFLLLPVSAALKGDKTERDWPAGGDWSDA